MCDRMAEPDFSSVNKGKYPNKSHHESLREEDISAADHGSGADAEGKLQICPNRQASDALSYAEQPPAEENAPENLYELEKTRLNESTEDKEAGTASVWRPSVPAPAMKDTLRAVSFCMIQPDQADRQELKRLNAWWLVKVTLFLTFSGYSGTSGRFFMQAAGHACRKTAIHVPVFFRLRIFPFSAGIPCFTSGKIIDCSGSVLRFPCTMKTGT